MLDNDPLALRQIMAYAERYHPELDMLWCESDAQTALRLALAVPPEPDVLLVDMSLDAMTGADVCREIRSRTADIAIVGMTSYDTARFAPEALYNGAQCIVGKESLAGIFQAIRTAYIGDFHAIARNDGTVSLETAEQSHERIMREDASAAGPLTHFSAATPPAASHADTDSPHPSRCGKTGLPLQMQALMHGTHRIDSLSNRERQTLHALASGIGSLRQVASMMGVTVSAVKTYLFRCRIKLGVADTADAVRMYVEYEAQAAQQHREHDLASRA
ncbi:MAG: DNA-binding response regulator [Bifidobacteriaceae bacterium]|nr:DNA-binding response regulator [Bifidobacteriaceae bacterium]